MGLARSDRISPEWIRDYPMIKVQIKKRSLEQIIGKLLKIDVKMASGSRGQRLDRWILTQAVSFFWAGDGRELGF